jgi:acetylornithine/LysW-gamma-L-lysine aminotransferase
MNASEIIQNEETLMPRVYAKRPLMLVRGKGALVWDDKDGQYIDCTSSYGVSFLGHCHPAIIEAITRQAERLIACHGSFYNDIRSELVRKIVEASPKGLDKVFLSNSGAEAVESALKFARKWTGKPDVIAMMGSFHGKTMGALSATWDKKYREPFQPLLLGFRHVPYGNSEKLREVVTEKTAAVIVEPIQGEGGVRLPPAHYLTELREICDDRNVLLIFDEVQTGFGRTGRLFASEHWGVVPDIVCLGKAVAGGLPMGITIAKSEVVSTLKVGEHSSTFGGGPLVCAACKASFDLMTRERLWERAAIQGERFRQGLERLQSNSSIIRDVRGLGLMLGVEFKFDVLNIITECMNDGVLVLDAGRNVVRFLPAVVITSDEIDRTVNVFGTVVEREERARLRSPAIE